MKVVHAIGYFQPEFGYKEFYLARAQAKLGHQVHIITSDRIFPFPNYPSLAHSMGLPTSRRRGVGESTIDGVAVHRLPTLVELRSAILCRRVRQTIVDIRPDIIHTYEPSQLFPGQVLGARPATGFHLVADFQQFMLPRTALGKAFFYLLGRPVGQRLFAQADRILYCTPGTRDFLAAHYHLDRERLYELPLGFDPERFYFNAGGRTKIRDELGIRSDELLLITAGALRAEKRIELLIRALAELRPTAPKVKMLILGSGDTSYRRSLEDLGRQLGLEASLMFLDSVRPEKLREYYCATDLGVWSNLPTITIIEAMGCGLPVVIPDDPTVRHLASYGPGFLYRPHQVSSVVQVIREAVSHIDPTKPAHEQNRRRSLELGYPRLAARLIDVYEQILRTDRADNQR